MKLVYIVTFILALLPQTSLAQDMYQTEAKKIVERISGTKVPLDHPLVVEAAEKLRAGNKLGAAQSATKHPGFLNTTVKLMALKMSTREETLRLLLNDFAASFIGTVRDNRDARELLTGNFYYAGDAAAYMTAVGSANIAETDLKFLKSNEHYQNLENSKIDIGSILVRREQQKVVGRSGDDEIISNNPDPAGVLTSSTFIREHAEAGTNRRLVEYTFREFMCLPLEDWADAGVSDAWVGRDIDRFPGGDHKKYQTSCKSCHTVMDGFRGAFAKWNHINGGPTHFATRPMDGNFNQTTGVADKMTKNGNVYPGGYVITSEAFINNARGPANEAIFGWREFATGGAGVNGFGKTVAHSRRFSQCMVKRVYDSVCRANLDLKKELGFVKPLAEHFEKRNYNIRELYEQIAIIPACLGTKAAQ